MGADVLFGLAVVLAGGIYEFGFARGVMIAAIVYLLMPYVPRR